MPKRELKKAQVAIFVIIAVLLISGVVIYFTLPQKFKKTLPKDVQAIRDYAQDCVGSGLDNSLLIIGMNRGYVSGDESLGIETGNIKYWYSSKEIKQPDVIDLEKEMQNYISNFVKDCDFSSFKSYDINTSTAKVIIRIKNESVESKVEWQIIVKKQETVYELDKNYNTARDIRLGLMHSYSQGLLKRISLEPEYRPLDYLVSTFNTAGINVTILPYDDKNDVYIIKETNKRYFLNNNPYNLLFAANFE